MVLQPTAYAGDVDSQSSGRWHSAGSGALRTPISKRARTGLYLFTYSPHLVRAGLSSPLRTRISCERAYTGRVCRVVYRRLVDTSPARTSFEFAKTCNVRVGSYFFPSPPWVAYPALTVWTIPRSMLTACDDRKTGAAQ